MVCGLNLNCRLNLRQEHEHQSFSHLVDLFDRFLHVMNSFLENSLGEEQRSLLWRQLFRDHRRNEYKDSLYLLLEIPLHRPNGHVRCNYDV